VHTNWQARSTGKRDRDGSAVDRVSILLDMDRDYQACYRAVDQRDCLAETAGAILVESAWYVAVQSDEQAGPRRQRSVARTYGQSTHNRHYVGGKCHPDRSRPQRAGMVNSGDARPRPEGMGLLQFIAKTKQ
jgi:hypothetical protein